MNNINNKKLNWETILSLKEFKAYLNKSILIQLNLTNKKFNNLLKSITFEHIELTDVIDNVDSIDKAGSVQDKTEGRSKECEEDKNRLFNFYTKSFSNYSNFVKKVTIQDPVPKFLFTQLPLLFQNLNSLTFLDMILEYSTFTNIIHELNLISLSIYSCLLVHEPSEKDSINLFEFPSNLKYLSIKTWRLTDSFTAKDLHYFPYDRLYDYLEDWPDENIVDFNYIKLANLNSFIFLNTNANHHAANLFKFLKLNPTIKILELDINYFNLDFFHFINTTNIKKLVLRHRDDVNEDFNEMEIPVLERILRLDLTDLEIEYEKFERKLVKACVNVRFIKRRKESYVNH
jgi:hypothetical protein